MYSNSVLDRGLKLDHSLIIWKIAMSVPFVFPHGTVDGTLRISKGLIQHPLNVKSLTLIIGIIKGECV